MFFILQSAPQDDFLLAALIVVLKLLQMKSSLLARLDSDLCSCPD